MDTMAVEQYAVDAVRDCINYSDHLSPFVSDNDKEPSWDCSPILILKTFVRYKVMT